MTASQIIQKTTQIYFKNFKKFLPYILLLGAVMFLSSLPQVYNALEAHHGFFIRSGLVLFLTLLIFITTLSVLSMWVNSALSLSIKDAVENNPAQNWKTILKSVKPILWPAIYTSLLVGIIIFGGTLLFIVPGIIFSVWYVFSIFAVVFDGKKGLKALKTSKELIVGRWFHIFWRVMAPGFLFGIIATILILIITIPINWSAYNYSSRVPFSALTPTQIPSTGYYDQELTATLNSIQTPTVPVVLITNLVTSLVYMFFIPLTSISLIILYLDAKQNPFENTNLRPIS